MSGELVPVNGSASAGQSPVIEYWQGRLQVVAFGARDAGRSLPQDEATAAVVLGALLARNLADGRWPGEYRAVVRTGGASVEVAEDDPRVAAARGVLRGLFEVEYGKVLRREFRAEELQRARGAVLAVGAGSDSGVATGTDEGGV